MLHIRPVLEKDASKEIAKTYDDIKKTFNIHFVPLLFQYLAGFEDYFLYAWEKQKVNIQSNYYAQAVKDLIDLSQKSIHGIYRQSKGMHAFLLSISPEQKKTLQQTAVELEELNVKLLILTIGLREGVKGVTIGQGVLPKDAGDYEKTIFDEFINQKIMHENLKQQEKDITPASKMLSPLFGSQSPVVSKYPEFFSHIAYELEELATTEKYLNERVRMEQQALLKTNNLPYPLGCSYKEIATFAAKLPYFNELLYILSETFPTRFPKLVFTTSLMRQVLQ